MQRVSLELLSLKAAVMFVCALLSLVYPHISPTSHLKVTNDRTDKCSWSLQLCWTQSGDLAMEGFERSVGCDALGT